MKSSIPVRKLPAPVGAIGRRLPRLPASIAFATGLNLTLRRKFPADVLDRLEGHTFVIVVEDAGMELRFRVRNRRFVPVARAAEPVLRFRAVAWDYASLAAREADPDTLFFNRRLVVEGDTEIALLVKNTLDTIDIPRTRGLLKRAMRVAGPARG
ncbi:MAG TPA: SCP2 sterol-binding domain-containing protein [Usitatibacteraceae bacterium]|jgi:predicted lipid carrier protein YhbT|nr:SCP2 sterol-binding domain-containing protein [Burkholderiales bacterium]MBZ0248671.1 SCP2 sterol-binding domain-containing protein [Burkholderiales bacterium]HRA22560.1 SCP2 sterol-binding domain-containing protein [Usitatibacteraceae bacterium]